MAVTNGVPADKVSVPWGQAVTPELVEQELAKGDYDLVAITHTETSTGVANPLYDIAPVLAKHPDIVWCVDAVSFCLRHEDRGG